MPAVRLVIHHPDEVAVSAADPLTETNGRVVVGSHERRFKDFAELVAPARLESEGVKTRVGTHPSDRPGNTDPLVPSLWILVQLLFGKVQRHQFTGGRHQSLLVGVLLVNDLAGSAVNGDRGFGSGQLELVTPD